MCGLCGEIRLDGSVPSAAALERMTAALAPRGPDGVGMLVRDHAALGQSEPTFSRDRDELSSLEGFLTQPTEPAELTSLGDIRVTPHEIEGLEGVEQ